MTLERRLPDPEMVTVGFGDKAMSRVLRPGEKLPSGVYVKAWSLDPTIYGLGVLYLLYQPEEEDGRDEAG